MSTEHQEDPHEVIICSACQKPLFSFNNILAEKIDVFSKAVYTYQLEGVLPDHGIEGGCHLYSATNPGAVRFDVFRVKTHHQEDEDEEKESEDDNEKKNDSTAAVASNENESKNNKENTTTKSPAWNKLTVSCQTNRYTTLYTWFPGYSWCMVGCENCKSHIGWGFSPVDPGDDKGDEEDEQEEEEEIEVEVEQEENNTNDDDDDEENSSAKLSSTLAELEGQIIALEVFDGKDEADVLELEMLKEEEQRIKALLAEKQNKNKKKVVTVVKKKVKKPKPPRKIRDPTFIGVIFGHIRSRQMSETDWNAHLKRLSSISVRYGIDLLRCAWPVLDDASRATIVEAFSRVKDQANVLFQEFATACEASKASGLLDSDLGVRFAMETRFSQALARSTRSFISLTGNRSLRYAALSGSAYIERRRRRRTDDNEDAETLDREEINIPGFRRFLLQKDEEYLLEPGEDEEYLDSLSAAEFLEEVKKVLPIFDNGKVELLTERQIKTMMEVAEDVEGSPLHYLKGLIMIFNMLERWRDQYLTEDGAAREFSPDASVNNDDGEDFGEEDEEGFWEDFEGEEEEEEEQAEEQAEEQPEVVEEEEEEEAPENQQPVQHQEEQQPQPQQPQCQSPPVTNELPLWKLMLFGMFPEMEALFF